MVRIHYVRKIRKSALEHANNKKRVIGSIKASPKKLRAFIKMIEHFDNQVIRIERE